ncbi:hypothetical protein [Cytobacillus sp. BC1816]
MKHKKDEVPKNGRYGGVMKPKMVGEVGNGRHGGLMKSKIDGDPKK